MIPKPEGCNACAIAKSSKGFCPDKIPSKAQYLFWAEAPGSTEIVKGEPFVGQAGFVLRQWLVRQVPVLQIALETDKIGLANTLRCLPEETQGRPYPKGLEKLSAEAHCRQYDQIPETVHTFVLFGENAQRLYFKDELEAEDAMDRRLGHDVKGVMGRIGRVYEREGKRYVFAPHPAWILRQPALTEHGQMALTIAANTEKVLDVQYSTDWDHVIGELMQ